MLLYRWPKKAIIVIVIILSLMIGVKFLRHKILGVVSFIHGLHPVSLPTLVAIKKQSERTTVDFAPLFSHLYSCPVCFGYGICNQVMKSSILFHGELVMPYNNRIVWKKGVLHTQRVLISSLVAEEWNRFDEFICRNASYSVPCDIPAAIWKTSLALDNLLKPDNFKNLNILLDIPFNQFALPVCSSKKLLKEIKKSFDENFDGHISREERIQLLTSLIMQPGYVVMKLQAKTKMTMPIPNLLGACGRSVVLEGGLKPLKSFLSESFDTRAGLAIQVLQLVQDFEKMHDLSCLLRDISSSVSDTALCNEVCFQKITIEMFYEPSNSSSCSHISKYGQLMYALVCKDVLSNIEDHKSEGFFNFDGHRVHKRKKHPGLLHKIPLVIEDSVESLLRECVQETKPNGRLKAVTQLRDLLENYVNVNNFESHVFSKNTFKFSKKV
ncbi:divergent protein kinase domain 2A isoform X2 [Parasteatoda tepidariorum]|uniref:divergent protein kinase domain 2A isoform X2 n=1 Tax=Parasteatoda tepidariorum TaxID=114398 RepID=UPI00077FBF5C|nr:uncharacterized protein LOC107448564 isoform X2 [Parasteatoda tepidariorum]